MSREFSKKFYKSKEWISCRKAYISERIKKDGGMCEHCASRLGYIVDHIEELNENNIKDAEVAFNFKNFQYLCLICHNKKTFGRKKKIFFGEDGSPLPPIE